MRHKRLKLSIVLLLGLGLTTLQAQETSSAAGGNATGSGGSISYTLGQVVYTTISGTNGFVAQGVQQPYEISVVTTVNKAKSITLNCSVFPNPTVDIVKLKVENLKIGTLTYKIYDSSGKLLVNKKLESTETVISMKNFASAIYFLKVTRGDKDLKVFKIIKN